MNLDKSLRQIEDQLPNGFHDAVLQSISLDLLSNTASLRMQLLVGETDATSEEAREAYRTATLTLEGLVYFVIDSPDSLGRPLSAEGVRIDGGDATDRTNPRAPAPRTSLPPGTFAHWFFVHEWNSFIHIAARQASLQWLDAAAS